MRALLLLDEDHHAPLHVKTSRVSTPYSYTAHQPAMIVAVDDKAPPPYSKKAPSIHSNVSVTRGATLNRLPPHILLQVIYWTCPEGINGERRRMMLYWMCTSLRYVSRDLWIATMHILRSSYLPLYTSQVLRPFSTDPFPSANPIATRQTTSFSAEVIVHDVTPIISTQRETAVLDSFILIRARQDMRSDESDLYLDNDDSDERYRDMFNYMQPRARLEDLVCKYGTRYDLISLPSSSSNTPNTPSYPSPTPSYTTLPPPAPIVAPASTSNNISRIRKTPFSDISITWGNRSVSLCTKDSQGRRRVITETTKERLESLEGIARRLVGEWWRIEKDNADIASRKLSNTAGRTANQR